MLEAYPKIFKLLSKFHLTILQEKKPSNWEFDLTLFEFKEERKHQIESLLFIVDFVGTSKGDYSTLPNCCLKFPRIERNWPVCVSIVESDSDLFPKAGRGTRKRYGQKLDKKTPI